MRHVAEQPEDTHTGRHGDDDELEITRTGDDDTVDDDEYATLLLPARIATVLRLSFGSRRVDTLCTLSTMSGEPESSFDTVRHPSHGVSTIGGRSATIRTPPMIATGKGSFGNGTMYLLPGAAAAGGGGATAAVGGIAAGAAGAAGMAGAMTGATAGAAGATTGAAAAAACGVAVAAAATAGATGATAFACGEDGVSGAAAPAAGTAGAFDAAVVARTAATTTATWSKRFIVLSPRPTARPKAAPPRPAHPRAVGGKIHAPKSTRRTSTQHAEHAPNMKQITP